MPSRHGAKFNCADPTTWPTPTATLVTTDDQYGTVTVAAWAGLHPKQQRHPGHGSRGPGRSCAAPSSACKSSGSLPARARPRCCGCGGPAPTNSTRTWLGEPRSAGSTWNTPSGSASRPLGGRPHDRAIPTRPTAGPGWCWPAMRSCAWPAGSWPISGCRGSGPVPSSNCRPCGSGGGFRSFWSGSARRPARRNPAGVRQGGQGPTVRARPALPGRQEGRLSGHHRHNAPAEARRPIQHGCRSTYRPPFGA
jgi:hypothetical protein